MQEKESIKVVWCELKIPSLGITVRHHLASLVMPNSYPREGIFNQHLTTIKDSYNLVCNKIFFLFNIIEQESNVKISGIIKDHSRSLAPRGREVRSEPQKVDTQANG